MKDYDDAAEPTRAEIDALTSPLLIEFGAPWCGYCIAAQVLLETALAPYPGLQHIKVVDGPGRRLGRSFSVKRWPTLIIMANGQEVARLVRPTTADEILQALRRLPGQV
jgi:thioredoxin 1